MEMSEFMSDERRCTLDFVPKGCYRRTGVNTSTATAPIMTIDHDEMQFNRRGWSRKEEGVGKADEDIPLSVGGGRDFKRVDEPCELGAAERLPHSRQTASPTERASE